MKLKLLTINLVIIILLLNLTVVVAQSQEINNDKVKELAGKEITDIEIKGNKIIDDQQLLEKITTKVGTKLDSETLQKDMQLIFDLGYFFDIQILFESTKSGVKVIFEVIENPEIEKIQVSGNNNLSTEKIKDLLGVELPEILNVKQLNEGMKEVNEYYQEQGYILANITDVTIKNKNELHLTINEGLINQIKISGNEKTKEYVIRREMATTEDAVFNVEELRDDIETLYRLGYFKSVMPEFERIEDSNQVDVIIKVDEQKTGNFNIGVGYSSTAKITGMINVIKDNLGGRGQKVNLNWEFGGEKNNFE
ncbi:MAG: POTRA domain-containing protein, partial [Bacillota bacterium]